MKTRLTRNMNDETVDFFMEEKRVALGQNKEVRLNDESGAGIFLSVVSDGETLLSLPVDYPSAGYGGGSLLLSPSGSYLLFSYYSGQSEEAFSLYRIVGDRLEAAFESPYEYGEAASYGFSDDESLLVQGLPACCTLWEWEDYMEDGLAEMDENGETFFCFGYINILDIEKKELGRHLVRVYPPEGARGFGSEVYDPLMSPKMTAPGVLRVTMPWGDETLDLPLEGTVRFNLV